MYVHSYVDDWKFVSYLCFLKYIRALRKQGDIEKLRIAREAMSELFPLTPAMWQEWTKDEISLSSGYCILFLCFLL